MSIFVHLRERARKGQGLVEYAFVIVFVALVTIVVVALLGESIQDTFCDVLMGLGENAPSDVEACAAPRVSCSGVSSGSTVSGPVNLEAIVKDNDGASNIKRVKFYVDGTHVTTENHPRYCMGKGDSTCGTRTLSPGTHTLQAIAEDNDGNTGECTVTVTVN